MKKNILANLIGKVWGVFANFIFIPIYISILGFNSYSVISFTLIIAGLIAILDSGLTATLAREFSRMDNNNESKKKIYESLQLIYFFITILGVLIIIFFSDNIASSLTVNNFTKSEISYFLKIVSLDLSFQLLFRFYLGGILGLNKQVNANIIQVSWGVFRSAIVIPLILIKPTLEVFFIWQAFSTLLFVLVVKYSLDKILYNSGINFRLKFDRESYLKVKKFAGGMLLISLISALSSQADKLMISKLLNLNELGYYTLAVSLSSILIVIISPISTAILPKLTEYYSLNQIKNVKSIFNQYNSLISAVVFSILSNIVLFDKEIIEIWTKDIKLAELSYNYVPFVSTGYAFMVLQTMCYQIAVASGFTKINNIMGIINIIFMLPGYYIGYLLYEGVGISIVFMIFQLLNYMIYSYLINKKFINELFIQNILFKQIIIPLILTFCSTYLFYKFHLMLKLNNLFLLALIGLSVLFSLILCAIILTDKAKKKEIKSILVNKIRRR